MTEPSDGERRRRIPAREVLQQRLELYDARRDEMVLEGEVRRDGLSLGEGKSEAFSHEIDQLAVIRRHGRTEEAGEDVLRFSRRDARLFGLPGAPSVPRAATWPPTTVATRAGSVPSASAAAGATGAGGHARTLLVGVASALLARGLDLRQEGLVLRPLHGDLLADELLDGLDLERPCLVGQADGLAGGARARRASDAVHVVLGVLRHVPVDHVGHALDMQTTRGDIGGDEDGQLAVLEVVEDLEPLFLLHVAGEGARRPAVAAQPVLEAAGLFAGIGEDEDAAASLPLEETQE